MEKADKALAAIDEKNKALETKAGQLEAKAKEFEAKMALVETESKAMKENMAKLIEEKSEVRSASDENYGFLAAKADYQKGLVLASPLWNDYKKKRFLEYAGLVAQRRTNGEIAKELKVPFVAKAFGDNVQDGLWTSAAAYGWTPPEFLPELVRLIFVGSLMLKKVTIVPMQREVVRLPMPLPLAGSSYYDNWYNVGFVAKGTAMTDTKIQAAYLEMIANKQYAITVVDREDLMDPAYNFASYLAMQMAEDLAKHTDMTILYSNAGRAASGTFNYDSALWNGIESGSSVYGTIRKVTGSGVMSGVMSSIMTYANLQLMLSQMTELSIDGAEWYFAPAGAWLARGLVSAGATQFPLIPFTDPLKIGPFGFPLNPTSRMYGRVDSQSINSSRMVGLLGNAKWCYFGDRLQMGVDTSDQYRFANDQIVFRALARFAVGVGLPDVFCGLFFPAT